MAEETPRMDLTRGIIYYNGAKLDPKIARKVRDRLLTFNLPITSCTLTPIEWENNILLNEPHGYRTMFKQILTCLENAKEDIIYFCEADVLYHPSHFDFTPPEDGKFHYNVNWWKIFDDGYAVSWEAAQVSGLIAYREHALKWYRNRVATYTDDESFDRKFEPGSEGEGYTVGHLSASPNVDIRHKGVLTYSKRELKHFRNKATAVNFRTGTIDNIPGWEGLKTEYIYG
jgi:hypothetical protein